MNNIFSPFYLHYQVDPKVQPIINKKVHSYRDSFGEKPQQPEGWECKVETSYPSDPPSRDQDEMNLRSSFEPYINHARDSIGLSRRPFVFSSWYNAYTGDQFQEKHDHIGAKLSGVYFVQYDPEVHAQFSFINPLDQLLTATYPELMMSEGKCPLFDAEHVPEVEQGSLIIFPSFLVHKVSRSNENYTNPRITFSFNIYQ